VRASGNTSTKGASQPATATVQNATADQNATAEPDAGMPDADNVQQGDQSTPDTGGATGK